MLNFKMQVAIEEAKKAFNKGEIPIGAAIFHENTLIAAGHNLKESLKSPTAHAEMIVIEKACKVISDWRLSGFDLFVTAEPCFMCAGAILHARISSVYYGVSEPKFGGVTSKANLFDVNTNHKVKYYSGIRQDEIAELMRNFFKIIRAK